MEPNILFLSCLEGYFKREREESIDIKKKKKPHF